MFRAIIYPLVVSVLPVLAQHGKDYSETMGPVAFMWPPDREWGAAQDNTAPCGSAASVVNRTDFPLVNGQIALVSQDESWEIQVAISYSNSPTTNNDFRPIIASTRIAEIDEGHMCYPVPNPNATDNIRAGANATLQIMYTSDFEEHRNQTFYACADIRYVAVEQFTTQVPCFNATIENFNVTETNNTSSASASSGAARATSSSNTQSQERAGMSGGAIAGIVIGVLVGVAALIGAVFFFWRKRQQQSRLRAQETSVRNVKWEDSLASSTGSPAASDRKGHDIVLSDMRH